MNRPRSPRRVPRHYDPIRRLAAAYTVRAVIDYLYPIKKMTVRERRTAAQFIKSAEGQELIALFGIPVNKIYKTIERN